MYTRILEKTIKDNLFKGKILILYGARQVGKTTLIRKIYDEYSKSKIILSGDNPTVQENLKNRDPITLHQYFNNSSLLIIDEAQAIENIGRIIKTYHDVYKDVQIILTGSSSFDLSNKIREPLTGRSREYIMYPLSVQEIVNTDGLHVYKSREENFFRFGYYPGIINEGEDTIKQDLKMLENNTFYKDILALENIKKPKILQDIIRFLAFNLGSVVTSSNISREIGATIKTVERYTDILEKMFVIKKLYAYSNNKSNEIKKGYKIYFVDIGLRNAIIDSFSLIQNRIDIGQIFENIFVIEKIKNNEYNMQFANTFFWQGERGLEVDYLEESNGEIRGYECKWKNRKSKGVKIFEENYKDRKAKVIMIYKENYLEYLL